MLRRFTGLALALSLVSPADASRIFRTDQQTFLKGIDPAVASSSCTWTTSGLILDINPADTSKLWQTITATTAVTADGDVVGTAQDTSGNAFDLTAAANDTTRPTYNTSGGLSWLTFDGSNDVLNRAANLGLYSGGAMTLEIAYRETTSQQASIVSEGNTGNATPYYDPLRHNAGSPSTAYVTSRDDSNAFELNAQGVYTAAYTTNTDGTLIVTDSGTNVTGYMDGNTGTSTGYSRATHSNANNFSFGARKRTTTDSYYVGRIYRLRAFNRVLNSTERSNDFTCLKATQGR